MRAFALGAAVVLSFSCSAAPLELVLRVDTDATVPDREVRDPLAPNVAFDRLEIALFDDDATEPCEGCSRTFAVDAQLFREQRASISVPLERSGVRARVRLFLAGTKGTPRVASTVETVVRLPRSDAHAEVLVDLATAAVGQPASLDAPSAAVGDDHRPSRVGTWPDRGPACAADGPPGTACIPARAYWLRLGRERDDERLVVLSSFAVDVSEWSVARFHGAGGQATDPGLLPSFPGPACPDDAPSAHPAACMAATEAQRLCRSQGGRLPTLHELALLTGGLTGGRFPWGDDPATCADAVIARLQPGAEPLLCSTAAAGGAKPGPIDAALPFGRDQLALPSGTVLNLAGNLSEWVENTNAASCDDGLPLRIDPRCTSTRAYAASGGSYLSVITSGALVSTPGVAYPDVGFRCVYDR